MADLDVSLVLRLRNLLGRGLGDARRDLKGVKADALALRGGARGAAVLATDLKRAETAAAKARAEMDRLREIAQRTR